MSLSFLQRDQTMIARFRSWWQNIKLHRVAIGVVTIVLVVVIVVIALIIAVVLSNATGFNGYNKVTIAHTINGTNAGTVIRTEEQQPGKTLWDWLQLLIIPLVLAIIALVFQRANSRTERRIAKDKQREELLQIYLDRMSELLLKEKLVSLVAKPKVRNMARVRTITILFQLDASRIGYVFAFLREAELMSNKPDSSSIVSLSDADLNKINLSQANLYKADLRQTYLVQANLSGARLSKADLINANLSRADLSGAILNNSNLSRADLSGAILSGADLINANLSRANLSRANLSEANLSGAYVTTKQLKKAKSLEGTTMPNGIQKS
jgi:Pentapeptide repeats (8 copies)